MSTQQAAESGQLVAHALSSSVSSPIDSDRMRDFAKFPEGMDSPRYRALGNAVTASVAQWIAERIKAVIEAEKEAAR